MTDTTKNRGTADFSTTIVFNKSAQHVFDSINNPSKWFGDIEGNSAKIGDEFNYRVEDIHYSRQRVVEMIPNERIVWLVTDSKLSFITQQDEWTGSTIVFDIIPDGDQTKLTFTHQGLKPQVECFDACSNGWSQVLHKSLQSFINSGEGVKVF
jgi:uncharacterized protein YndB with AHSA1/START domain